MKNIEEIKSVINDYKESHCKNCSNNPKIEGGCPQFCVNCRDKVLELFTKEEVSEYNLYDNIVFMLSFNNY